jgi:hypothetical protein
MKKFVIERILPGAGNLSPNELKAIAQSYCEVARDLGTSYHWIQSFVTENKIYCIDIAESEELIREHARRAKFAVHAISEVKIIIDPLTSRFQ